MADTPSGKAGEDRWYGFSVYLGNDWDLTQVNNGRDYFMASLVGFRYTQTPDNGPGTGNWGGRVVDGVRLFSGATILANGDDAGRISGMPLVKGQWVDFVQHIKWSRGSDGFREVWQNGVKLGRYDGVTVGTDSVFEHRIGLYEGTQVNHTRTTYFDNHRVGTSYAAVDPSR